MVGVGVRGDGHFDPAGDIAELFGQFVGDEGLAEGVGEGEMDVAVDVDVAEFALGRVELGAVDAGGIAELPVGDGDHVRPGLECG